MQKFFVIRWVKRRVKRKRVARNSGIKNRKDYLLKKEQARNIVLAKLTFWKSFYKESFGVDFVWNRVAIKNSKTRWGSCSSKKNLNFSYKIFDIPTESQDYLVVHELCHLVHMNHSKTFWELVERGVPDFEKQRKYLQHYNMNLK